MIQLVIPMAGAGSRFAKAGYALPKPFIPIEGLGKPMIHCVLDNLNVPDARFILLVRKEHAEQFGHLFRQLLEQYPAELVLIDQLTEGAACTVLHARKLIDNDLPLVIANSDQLVDVAMADFLADAERRQLDGSILTFFAQDTKWSYAKLDQQGYVSMVREKEVISDQATVGIYHFRTGRLFVDAAVDMIARNDRVNNEFYVCPVYNHAIADGAKIGVHSITPQQMHGVGTPEDLKLYEEFLRQ